MTHQNHTRLGNNILIKKNNNTYLCYQSWGLELSIFADFWVGEMSSLLFRKGFIDWDTSWNAFLLNVNHYIRSDLKNFFSGFVKRWSICVFYWVVWWSRLLPSGESPLWHIFPRLSSETSHCQLENSYGGSICPMKSTNTINHGYFFFSGSWLLNICRHTTGHLRCFRYVAWS